MVIVGHLGGPLSVMLGFVGIVLQIGLGATVIRRNWSELGRLTAASQREDARFSAVLRRTSLTSQVYLLVMVAVIAVMVLKPTA